MALRLWHMDFKHVLATIGAHIIISIIIIITIIIIIIFRRFSSVMA
jgi:hypothetical protein